MLKKRLKKESVGAKVYLTREEMKIHKLKIGDIVEIQKVNH